MKRYKTLLMDADETIFDFEKAERQAFWKMTEQCGLHCDDLLYARYSAINQAFWKMLERKEIAKKELLTARFEQWLSESGQTGDAVGMNECYLSKLAECAFLFEDSEEALRELSEKCRIYLITNGTESVQTGRFARTAAMRYVKDAFISGEIGYEKPDRRYFEAVIGRIGDYDAESTLVVGDSPTSDLAGAIEMGIDSCWVNRRGKKLPEHIRATFEVPDLLTLCNMLGKEN